MSEEGAVEVFRYSGRLNPQWKLSRAQMAHWITEWEKAPPSPDTAARVSKLGYTGCLLKKDKDKFWIIFNGCISLYEGKKISSRKDENRKMERWLLATAPGDMYKMATTFF